MNIIFLAVLVWLLFMPLAILNGTIRQYVYKERVGELRAHQISSIIFIVVVFTLTGIFLSLVDSYTDKELILIGIIWTTLTILFEFVFGHYVMKHSWEKLFADYNFKKGRIWGLVLLSSFAAPVIVGLILDK